MRNTSTYCSRQKLPLQSLSDLCRRVGGLLFYHPDHLGSSSFITDVNGEAYQHYEYMPYGELFVEQKGGTDQYTPYLFNGKELDDKTGLYYYGARYLDPKTSIWLSVDPLMDKYPNVSSYMYCAGNPIMYFDPNGEDLKDFINKWNGLNNKEKNIIRWHPQFYKATNIEKNADIATSTTKATFGRNGKGDKSDAFRHAYWQALNTQEVGAEFTEEWSDAHESSTPSNEVSTDLYMDIHNNNVGIEVAKNNPDASPEEIKKIILEKIENGEMLIINNDNKLVKSDGTKIKNISEIRRAETSQKIAKEILKDPKGQKTPDYE